VLDLLRIAAVYNAGEDEARRRGDSLTLNVPDAPAATVISQDPQSCFDQLVRRYEANKKTTLSPDALKDFGQTFVATCR